MFHTIETSDNRDPRGNDYSFSLGATFAQPGGNVKGFGNFVVGLTPKLLDLLSELVPQANTIAILVNPNNPITEIVI
jgi:putative tryptophan/tyrosine transport system substrate-binding protein